MNNRSIHGLVELQAARTPDATAVVFEHQRISYAELNARANQVAHYLLEHGVGPETFVGIFARRTPATLTAMLGILKAGGAYVPLDPAYPAARLEFMIEDSAMAMVVTQQDLVGSLPATSARLVCLDSGWEAISRKPETNPETTVSERNLAFVIYTSGSTGRPKGVAIEHHSVVVYLAWMHSLLLPDELKGTLAGSSISFDLSVFEIFAPLTCGGAVILAENVLALATIPARNQVTIINTVPSAIAALVETGGVPDSVRVVVTAGDLLFNKIVHDVYKYTRVQKFYNMWGPCEDTVHSTFFLTDKIGVPVAGAYRNIGRAIPGTQVYIVDEQMNLVPDGTTGELCLGGEGLARGYLNRKELTQEKFIPNPFGAGRIYRSGDMGRLLPDGNIEFVGRVDNQVKVRGYRIELGEIEAVLDRHPAVQRAVVLALPDTQERLQLAAWIVPNGDTAETSARDEDTREYLDLWRKVYEDAYRETPVSQDPTFNTSSWKSSYTGAPFPEAEMREWLAGTVERIQALRPRRVLEIACGTGMLAVRIAPECESYTGLDLSPAALDHLRSMQGTIPGLERVILFERSADQLEDFESGAFDTVIINSVVQHFPDPDYLIRVLEGATRLVGPGGRVLVGDVMSQALHEAFFASIHTQRASDQDTAAQVRERIEHHAGQGRDLMIAPAFFLALRQRLPAIRHVEAWPRSGRYHNELTLFRYDVILHIGDADATAPASAPNNAEWLDWNRDQLTVGEVRRRIQATQPARFAIRNIPNARLDRERAVLPWLREAAPDETVGKLRLQLTRRGARGIEPDDILALEDAGYRAELSWLNTDQFGSYEVVLTRRDVATGPADFAPAGGWRPGSCADYASRKQTEKVDRQTVPQLRKYLGEKLPPYMVPAIFTVLDKLPLSPNGKVDRRALAQMPLHADPAPEDKPEVTEDPIERLLLKAWADVLNVGQIGLNDNFFELGGNSLRAISLTHRLQKELNCPVRPVTLLNSPTVTRFSAWLKETHPHVAENQYAVMHEGEI